MTRTTAAAGILFVAVVAVAFGAALHLSSNSTSDTHGAPAPALPISPPVAFAPRAHVTAMPITVVRRYEVLEETFPWRSARYSDPWEQVHLRMQLTSPAGRRYQVGGFFYATNQWQARFAPSEVGRWRWIAQLTDGRRTADYRGTLKVLGSKNPGFVRVSPYNHFRWSFANGSPYYPLGIQDCQVLQPGASSPLERWGLDGGFRPPNVHTEGRQVDINTYMRAYSGAHVNLFRWSVDNCSFGLYQTIDPSGNVYLKQGGMWGDQLVQTLRRYGFRVYMTMFNNPPFANNPTPDQIAAIERYVKYVVDRWGPYVDFWELMNESTASTSWYQQVGAYLHSIDPYHHPVSTSYEQPSLSVIDINSPHWYQTESQFDSDSDTWQRMAGWKQAGKPVVVGEQGNAGRTWDPTSGLRMRLRAWTSFFAEGTLIFWNGSFAKDGIGNAVYLGPQERRYLRVLQSFTTGFDPRATIVRISPSQPGAVRGYALRGPREYAAYLVAYTNHTSPTSGISVSIDPRAAGSAVWIDPATGAVLARRQVKAGAQRLGVPAFTTDIALQVS